MPEEEWQEGRFGGREQDLGGAAGSVHVGLRREVIVVGRQSSPRHAHMTEEEIFVVLQGRGTLLRGNERVPVEAGDVAAFPAGTGVAHAFVADAGEELEFLSIGGAQGQRGSPLPGLGQTMVAGIVGEDGERRRTVGRLQEADYFDGELDRLAKDELHSYLRKERMSWIMKMSAATGTRTPRCGPNWCAPATDYFRDGLNIPASFEMLPDVNGLSGLDVGCGVGHNTRFAMAYGGCDGEGSWATFGN